MAVIVDFSIAKSQDTDLVITLAPPAAIGGLDFLHLVFKRAGGEGSGLLSKSMASGFHGVSGMEIQNSGQGIMRITYNAVDTSGWETGNYWHQTFLTSSGEMTPVANGYILLHN